MGMFDDLIKEAEGAKAAPPPAAPVATEPKAAVRPGMFDDLIEEAQSVPQFRNSATPETGLRHEAVKMPSQIMREGISNTFGETAANVSDYLPHTIVGGMWADAYANEKMNPDPRGAGTKMLEQYENIQRGALQGTNPFPQPDDDRQALGEAFQDAGGAWMFQPQGGQWELVNPDSHTVLKDPNTGKLTAYTRSKRSDESGITGMSRVLSQGLLTNPVTGPTRAMSVGRESAGALAGNRATKATQDLAAFERAKIPVFPPAFSEGPVRGIAKSISDTPFVGGPLTRSLDRSIVGAGEAAEDVAGRFGSKPNQQQAGQTVREGIERYKDARSTDVVEDHVRALPIERLNQIIASPTRATSFKTKQGALYERAWKLLPDDMQKGKSVKGAPRFQSSPKNARATLDDIAARNSRMVNTEGGTIEAPPMAGGMLGKMIEAIRAPQWSANLQTLRDMRSEVRRLASGMSDTEKNVLKNSDLERIQSALTQDMIAQLQKNVDYYRKAGDLQTANNVEQSIREFSRADQFTRLSIERLDKIEKLFNADTGEALARNITNAALGGGKGNIQMLQTLNKTLRPDEMGEVRSMLFSQLGKPVNSARGTAEEAKFSVNTFATKWNAMSPEAKALLFDGEHRQAVDDIATSVSRLSNVDSMANSSRSGTHMANMSGLASLGYGLVTLQAWPIMATGAAGYGLAHMMANPMYAKWAANYMKIKSAAQHSPNQVNAALITHVNRLAEMARFDPQLQPVLQAISGELGVTEGQDGNRQKDENHSRTQSQEGEPRQRQVIPHRGHSNTGQE
jgi:hypothetical protein